MDTTAHAKRFASPHSGNSEAIVRRVATARLRRVRRDVASALTEAGATGAADALLAFTEGSETAWRPETGLGIIKHRTASAAAGALQVAAALAGMGGKGRLDVRVEAPTSVYLDGSIIDVRGSCSLLADAQTISITSDAGATEFIHSHRCWQGPEATAPWRCRQTGAEAPRYVTATEFAGAVERFSWIPERASPGGSSAPSLASTEIATIAGGWQVIADGAPAYAPWVASTAVGCALLRRSGRGQQSASSSDHPGLIAIEPPDDSVFCGEMLVHECSHQQLLAYASFAPLVSHGSSETCHSPIKRSHRPLLNVLFGAHAVGNMLLYYTQLQQTTTLDDASRGRFETHRAWFAKDYRVALDQSQSLTGAGRALWLRLCDVVDEQLG